MKEVFFLLFFLFPLVKNRFNMQEIYSSKLRRLNTDKTDNLFYVDIQIYEPKYTFLYLYFSDDSYQLNKVSYCLDPEDPEFTLKFCSFKDVKAYDTKTSNKIKESFYKINTTGRYHKTKYVIVKYSGTYTNGSTLYALSSYRDIYDLFYKDFNNLNIAFIIIGSTIIVSIVLYVIFYFCRRKIEMDYTIYSPFQLYGSSSTPSYPLYS